MTTNWITNRKFKKILATYVIVPAALCCCIKFRREIAAGINISISKIKQGAKIIREGAAMLKNAKVNTHNEAENAPEVSCDEECGSAARAAEHGDCFITRVQPMEDETENLHINRALHSRELMFLQSRVNMHFLFNTLKMIQKTAYAEQASDSARLLVITAELLRYNLDTLSVPVTLADEIESIKNYIMIQTNRYGRKISFRFEIDETCLTRELPSMILQPIVENAVVHGVSKAFSGGTITIRIYKRAGRCCLEIENDGVGIEPEKLEEINKDIGQMFQRPDEKYSGIGVRNVYQRLWLFFNGDVSFSLDCQEGRTIVYIDMPEGDLLNTQ